MESRTLGRRKAVTALAATTLTLALGAGLGAGTSYAGSPSDAASDGVTVAAKPKFQMPFKCNTHWRIDTWQHSPAVDIVVKGNTGSRGKPVYPGYKGKVAKTFWDRGAGNVIIINHGGGWYTAYYHLKEEHDKYVQKGDNVKAKTLIGHIGKTGSNSGDWEHLHYEQRYKANGIPNQSDRKTVHFNGKKYTGNGNTWKDVVSKNC